MKFGVLEHSFYGGNDNTGHAIVILITDTYKTIIEFIYMIGDTWTFLYENTVSISDADKKEFEQLFIKNYTKRVTV